MEEKDLIRFIQSVPGLCAEDDCVLLFRLVSELEAEGEVLEIGAFKGRTAAVLAKGLIEGKKNGTVYSVDANLFGTKDEILNNLERTGVKGRVVSIFKNSVGANKGWDKPLKFIWIDTDGNYLSAYSDFILWERFLARGGIIAFSCVTNTGIQRVIRECLVESGRFSGLTYTKKLCFAFKRKETETPSQWRIAYTRHLYSLYLSGKVVLYTIRKLAPFVKEKDSRIKNGIKNILERFL